MFLSLFPLSCFRATVFSLLLLYTVFWSLKDAPAHMLYPFILFVFHLRISTTNGSNPHGHQSAPFNYGGRGSFSCLYSILYAVTCRARLNLSAVTHLQSSTAMRLSRCNGGTPLVRPFVRSFVRKTQSSSVTNQTCTHTVQYVVTYSSVLYSTVNRENQ